VTGLPAQRDNMRMVSVVIPTHNNLSLLLECIESLRLQDYPHEQIEIVVVDNASTDRTRQVITDRFPYVKLMALDTNTGFAVACNRGAAAASGDYVAFLNNDAVADSNWISALLSTLDSSDGQTVCAASRILSRDGDRTEYDGAASNLFGAGRPATVWGWSDHPLPPGNGSPVLFASGGAMLIHRATFLEVGGFDPAFFAYFEDVDLGWRLWVLGYKVVLAHDAVVRHIGGATGMRTGSHRRYVLWESNSLATVIKNYEDANMQRLLSAALLLEYKRALMSTGDAINLEDYHLGGPKDTNVANVERLSKVSVAHLAAIDRLNTMLPHLMQERRDIQARRIRPDAEILPLLGRPFEPQYAGRPYAEVVQQLASTLQLYGITSPALPNRVLIVGNATDLAAMREIAAILAGDFLVALAVLSPATRTPAETGAYTLHNIAAPDSIELARLVSLADALVTMPSAAALTVIKQATVPVALFGSEQPGLHVALTFQEPNDPALRHLCREPGRTTATKQ
jgi:GT2 family glycosyltransferase